MFAQVRREADISDVSSLISIGRRFSDADMHRIWWELLNWREQAQVESRVRAKIAKVLIVSWEWKKSPHEIYIDESRKIVWIGRGYVIIHDEFTGENTCMNYKRTKWKENEIMVLLDTEC